METSASHLSHGAATEISVAPAGAIGPVGVFVPGTNVPGKWLPPLRGLTAIISIACSSDRIRLLPVPYAGFDKQNKEHVMRVAHPDGRGSLATTPFGACPPSESLVLFVKPHRRYGASRPRFSHPLDRRERLSYHQNQSDYQRHPSPNGFCPCPPSSSSRCGTSARTSAKRSCCAILICRSSTAPRSAWSARMGPANRPSCASWRASTRISTARPAWPRGCASAMWPRNRSWTSTRRSVRTC